MTVDSLKVLYNLTHPNYVKQTLFARLCQLCAQFCVYVVPLMRTNGECISVSQPWRTKCYNLQFENTVLAHRASNSCFIKRSDGILLYDRGSPSPEDDEGHFEKRRYYSRPCVIIIIIEIFIIRWPMALSSLSCYTFITQQLRRARHSIGQSEIITHACQLSYVCDVREIAQRPLFHFELDFRETIERLHQMINVFNTRHSNWMPATLADKL